MALSDIFSSIGGAVSPNMETLLAVVPTLLGAFEQGRGAPIGGALSAAGGLLGQHAGYRKGLSDEDALRQFVQQTVSNTAQTPEAAAQFAQLQPLLAKMNAPLAGKLLENVLGTGQSEIAEGYKNLPKPIRMGKFEDIYNPKAAPGQQFTDPSGKVVDPNAQLAQGTDTDALKGITTTKALAMDYMKNHGGSTDGLGAYLESVKRQDFANNQRAESARQLYVAHSVLGMRDDTMIPAQLLGPTRVTIGTDPSDKEHYLKEERYPTVAAMKEAVRNGKAGIFSKADQALLAKMKNITAGLGTLNQAAQAVLPKGGTSVLDNALNTKINQYAAALGARGGNVEASRLVSQPGLLLQELNQMLSGTTRAMANSEFSRFLGERNPLAGKEGGYLDAGDIRAIMPTPGVDTQETAKQKLQALAAVIQDRFDSMQLPMPMDAPGVMDLLGAPPAEPTEAPDPLD